MCTSAKYTIKIIGDTCSKTVFRGKTINLITAKFSEHTTFTFTVLCDQYI